MSFIQAVILGLIQGLSEFLPISSTAHLTIAGKLMGLVSVDNPEKWTAFIAVIQLGTLGAVLAYFSKDLINITKAFFKENFAKTKISAQSLNSRLGWYIIIGTLPICTIGLLMKKVIESSITKNLTVIGINLIILAIILFVAERVSKFRKKIGELKMKDAIWVGIAQCFALFPGASRSGTTITAGLFLNMERETAARFSFLLSIPAVLASGLLELKESMHYIDKGGMLLMLVSTAVAFISGYLTIALLLKFLKSHSSMVFIIYRVALGILVLSLLTGI